LRVAQLTDNRYPAISDLAKKAKKRIPHFAWEYLDSATGGETAMHRNEKALTKITMVPRTMKGIIEPSIETEMFGKKYSAPFGIPPIGYCSLMWPYAEQVFAKAAKKHRIPACLSTSASDTPENCGKISGEYGWFQLYPPRRDDIRTDLIQRAKDNGYHTLVVTADVPWPSMRERQRRAGITIPPKLTPKILAQICMRPEWALRTLMRGQPNIDVMKKYVPEGDLKEILKFVGPELGGCLDWDYFKKVRDQWDGPIVLKGILSTEDAKLAEKAGADGVWVSNHGGRQFEAAPTAISILPEIRKALGPKATILFDSGIRSGGDILRAIALGADFVFLGRPFVYGISAIGAKGADHVYELLYHDLINNMHQLGITSLEQMKDVELRFD
jgi:L-lactate dehydrogenase (cytochrome)